MNGNCILGIIICLVMGYFSTKYWPVLVVFLILIGVSIVNSIRSGQKTEESKIKSNPFNINFDDLDGYEFERYCANLLKANEFINVQVTPERGDDGVDIIADYNGKKYAIQCKRYKKNVGNKAVQEVYLGKRMYDADIAVVLTNSNFTEQAINAARKSDVELWNRHKLLELIDFANNQKSVNHVQELNGEFLNKSNVLNSINSANNQQVLNINTKENGKCGCILKCGGNLQMIRKKGILYAKCDKCNAEFSQNVLEKCQDKKLISK